MNLKRLNTLLAATALSVGAVVAFSTPADAYVRGCGWRHHWVYASDYAPRRSCYSGCSAPSYYSTPVVVTTGYPYGYGWGGGWGGGGLLGGLWPF